MSDKLKITSIDTAQFSNSEQNFFGGAVGYPDFLPAKAAHAPYPLYSEQPVISHWDAVVDAKHFSIEHYRDYARHAGNYSA